MPQNVKAKIAPVNIGNIEIEGLMLPDGSYAVSISQLSYLDLVPPNRSAKQLKALLGIEISSHQIASELNSKKVNIVTLDELNSVISASAKKGNQNAINLAIDLVGLSLVQLFSDAFGEKFDKEDRQAWLKSRTSGIITRRTLTDAIRDYIVCHTELSPNYKKFTYRNVSDLFNRFVFGKNAKDLRDERNVADNDALRDSHNESDLTLLEHLEHYTMLQIDNEDIEPMIAATTAIAAHTKKYARIA